MRKIARKSKSFLPYFIIILFLTIISFSANFLFNKIPHLNKDTDLQLLIFGSILFIGYYINRVAPKTIIPTFVWAIFAGMAMYPLLSSYTENISNLKIVMEIFGAIILFAGGMEIPFKNFRRWFLPIASLSLIGVVLSSLIFSGLLYFISDLSGTFNIALLPSIVILSAALASTDPTAIIPTLKTLHFKRSFLKQIAISESALTDVSGSILTRFLLIALISVDITSHSSNIFSFFLPLLKKSTYDAFALQIISGVIVGYFGFMLIKKFYRKSEDGTRKEDPALLLSVPIFTFVLGNILGGAGFLASFVSGLLSDVEGELKKASRFYESFLDHLIKPFIFIILGALVPVSVLFKLAPIGIVAAVLFMFLIRPFVVFVSLLPWFYKRTFKLNDLIFLSFVRETGIISAILIIIASTYNMINSEFVISIGMWIILLTLVVEPPLTPHLAKTVGVAEDSK